MVPDSKSRVIFILDGCVVKHYRDTKAPLVSAQSRCTVMTVGLCEGLLRQSVDGGALLGACFSGSLRASEKS